MNFSKMALISVLLMACVLVLPGCIVDNANKEIQANRRNNDHELITQDQRLSAKEAAQRGEYVPIGNLAVQQGTNRPAIVKRVPGGSEATLEEQNNILFVYHCVSADHSQIRRVEGVANAYNLRSEGWQVDPVLVPLSSANPMNGAFSVTVVYEDDEGVRYADRSLLQTQERYQRRNRSW